MKGTLLVTYHFYVKDHLGNNRMVLSESAAVEQVTHYYPYGLPFASSTSRDLQRFKYNGKELDTEDNLNWMDYGARMYDAALGRWNGVDRYSEKYSSMTPYGYCGGNPIANIDVNGDSIDVSGLSEDNMKWYNNMIGDLSSSAPFKKLYSYLEHSPQKIKIVAGTTSINDGGALFWPNGGGGTIKLDPSRATAFSVAEETFHALQNEKTKSGEYVGSYNPEFEAKSFAIWALIHKENSVGVFCPKGFNNEYYLDILYGSFTSENFSTPSFEQSYIKYANEYANFNRMGKIGNAHYVKPTEVAPYCLKLILNMK